MTDRSRAPIHPELVLRPEDERYLSAVYDDRTPLPSSAAALTPSNPRLQDLRRRYHGLDLPPLRASRWNPDAIDGFLDHRYFRGDTLITWHYRELVRATRMKYFVYATYVREHDENGLLTRLHEDGAFGCWTFRYPGHPVYSRDLLESVNEIGFLERNLTLSARAQFSVLDIGAGYGRLAHRMTTAYDNIADYCCIDAVPDATFLCDYYLRHRGCTPVARSVPLDEIADATAKGTFDLAINIHSFPECTHDAVSWWIDRVDELDVPALLVVPNEPGRLLTLETDGSRRDFMPLLGAAGYRLEHVEPIVLDPAVRELVGVHDEFFLFAR